MANHKSAEKRARQTIKKTERNRAVRSRAKTAMKEAREVKSADKAKTAISGAYKAIQKAKSVLHKNTIRRRMSRIAKAVNNNTKK